MAKRGWHFSWLRRACAAIVAITGFGVSAADDPVLATAFGTGVHAYHAGDYQRAFDDLTTVVEGGASDPRAFYFRGLAALKLGRLDEAEADFATGAAREAAAVGGWNVPRSLERIQGEDRLRLERHRSKARVALMQRRREAIVRRYTEIDAAQEGVLRRRQPETVPARESLPEAGKAPRRESSEELPEPDEDTMPAKKDAEDDEPASDDADSPFGDDTAPAAKAAMKDDAAGDEATEAEDDENPLQEKAEAPSE
jgi:hypothetical protein